MNIFQRCWQFVKEFFPGIMQALRQTSTDRLEFELREMENIFGLLVLGSFIGIPSPPTGISLRLMPHMFHEMLIMNRRVRDLDDMFGEIAGFMDI
ncbi:hypothetical protein U14_03251 [Candidatus Moduliflexus flocculans]|uniref:Uncharacterized protein n=1 Tax=Candidatus Moduliflexus flocculans TaxID=1499966 RepID=A0A081BNN9_9BACT|nr:hypothetical protein U14_03251 [Candidatus Moduliflexus flocculans]